MTIFWSEYDKYLHFPIISRKLNRDANEKTPVQILQYFINYSLRM